MGYVSYLVATKPNLPTGTQIRNVANVSFDEEQIIATDQVSETDPTQGTDPTKEALVTIDGAAPTSSVSALPATETSSSFTLNWSGTDDTGGSGINHYDIYVSDNGGGYSPFLLGTQNTSSTFTGISGHTYAFYSIATDNVGNVEAAPASADTTTIINSGPITWTGTADGVNWSNPGNWSDNLVPTQSDDVTIGSGFGSIHVGAGNFSVHSITASSPLEVLAGGTLNLYGQSTFGDALTIDSGALVKVAADGSVIETNALTILSGGLLDLRDNSMVVQNGDLNALFNQLKSGFNAGHGYWNGTTGILSSSVAGDIRFLTTLGESKSPGGPFHGINTTADDVLIKYTYYGDADLNGTINGADYQQIDQGFGSHNLPGWSYGDFNYDGIIDGSDFALIDNMFNQLTATGAGSLAIIASPSNLVVSMANMIAPPTTLMVINTALPADTAHSAQSSTDLQSLSDNAKGQAMIVEQVNLDSELLKKRRSSAWDLLENGAA